MNQTIGKYYMLKKSTRFIKLFLFMFFLSSCIVKYVPESTETEELVVIEGLITDQPGISTIKLTKSQPLWKNLYPKPLTGCIVSISDDLGQTYILKEKKAAFGIYITDSASFRGVPGRLYTLHIRTTKEDINLTYESLPMKMIPVPPIDSIYYEKKTFTQSIRPVEGCNIYLNSGDPSNKCRFYRWEYSETWEFHLPFNFSNNVCWISNNPAEILIKNASLLADASIIRHPVLSITNPIDRLSVKYSILVKQFSLNEDEYLYWERLKNTSEQVGGLYDQVPTAIPNNVYCLEEPNRKVLGYFCVSAMSSRRLFIKDHFMGYNGLYEKCISDTIFTNRPDTVTFLGTIIKILSDKVPPGFIYTNDRSCVDCTRRGTNIKPLFWDDDI
jgi:hypothetical protein